MACSFFVQTVLQLGKRLSMDVTDLHALCVKAVVLNLVYVDREVLCGSLFPDAYVDWTLAASGRAGVNTVGDVDVWIPFLELCKWDKLGEVKQLPPVVVSMCGGMREVGLPGDDWNLVCRLMIVHSLVGSDPLRSFQLLVCRSDRPDGTGMCSRLLAYLSGQRYVPSEFERAFAVILSREFLTIDTTGMEAIMSKLRTRSEERQMFQQMRELAVSGGRPRLRDRQEKNVADRLNEDATLSTWETYQGWTQLHQFSNTLSDTVKYRLYFLAAQTAFDWRPFVSVVLGRECALSEHVTQYPVSIPDVGVLSKVLSDLCMGGKAPFPELVSFRRVCFAHFPETVKANLTFTQVLRLYVSAYQNPTVWRVLWKQHVHLLSPQIIRDCQTFAESHPFNGREVVSLFT